MLKLHVIRLWTYIRTGLYLGLPVSKCIVLTVSCMKTSVYSKIELLNEPFRFYTFYLFSVLDNCFALCDVQ